ncbi:hypothetical protein GS399_02635 [Pedobacter sp. HMF7647]|uniref:DUF4157 domain-containing protein n=1 Tax=Hufsiella arboris TaxID=2695275 RepID=A0A7K1Y5J0_9SPHI|nr:hypothetical protein [Hufsiella arboris]MXV49852.1 hypothetical protein [Hufsiella arboris]
MICFIKVIRWLPAQGMAIFPLILIKEDSDYKNEQLINHEKIHLQQQLELLILPFYLLYLGNYLVNLIIYKSHNQAYRNIVFEREAFVNDDTKNYLETRRFYSWLQYI